MPPLAADFNTDVVGRTLPPAPDEEPDWENVAAVARANGCELLA